MKTRLHRAENTLQKAWRSPDDRVGVRPVSTADFDELRAMFSRLSPESVYRRFHTSLAGVPDRLLRRLVVEEDPGERRLVAVSESQVVGHAMYSTLGEGDAEVGVVVEDAWQSRGVGKLLLRRLATEARSAGLEAFTCVSLWENRQVAELITALCPAATFETRDGLRLVYAPLGKVEPKGPQSAPHKDTRERNKHERG